MNITGLNKAEVLAALYNNARTQGMGVLHYQPGDMSIDEAQKFLDDGVTYFDYVKGRVMKVDLGVEELDTFLYNRDNGDGAAERVLEGMKL